MRSIPEAQIRSIIQSQKVQWVPTLLRSFGSFDGRQREPIVATIGADIGQFLISLAAFELVKYVRSDFLNWAKNILIDFWLIQG
jgi:hypothetical protein